MSFDVVRAHLDRAGIRYALIGGVALAARGASRSTLDIDVLTTDTTVLNDAFWKPVREHGIAVDARKGDWDDPLRGVVHIEGEDSIDIVVGKYKWEHALVERAQPITVRGMDIRVPSAADLILLKLAAGGPRDLIDAATLLKVRGREAVIEELAEVVPTLPAEMQRRWNDFLQNNSSIGW